MYCRQPPVVFLLLLCFRLTFEAETKVYLAGPAPGAIVGAILAADKFDVLSRQVQDFARTTQVRVILVGVSFPPVKNTYFSFSFPWKKSGPSCSPGPSKQKRHLTFLFFPTFAYLLRVNTETVVGPQKAKRLEEYISTNLAAYRADIARLRK